ncbi:MAG: hypothetical protein F7O42_06945 [Opitutae bacterium]|nr:hypothetical protein [Opitutae bacterium]
MAESWESKLRLFADLASISPATDLQNKKDSFFDKFEGTKRVGPCCLVWLSFKASMDGDHGRETAHSSCWSDLPYPVLR